MLRVTFQFQFTSVNALTSTSWLRHRFPCALSFPSLSISLQRLSVCHPDQCKTNKPKWRHSGLWYKVVFVISRGLSKQKRSLPFSRWPSSASVCSQSYQNRLYFFKLWSMVVASTTPVYRGGKQEGRTTAVFFLPFHSPWLVVIKGCKHRIHGTLLRKKKKKINTPLKQPTN